MSFSSDRRLNSLEIFNYLPCLSGSHGTLIITTIENSLKFTFDVETHVLAKPAVKKELYFVLNNGCVGVKSHKLE